MRVACGGRPPCFLLFAGILLLGTFLFPGCHSDRQLEALSRRFEQHYRTPFAAAAGRPDGLVNLAAVLDTLQHLRAAVAAVDTHYLTMEGKELRGELLGDIERERRRWLPFQENPAMYNLAGLLKAQLAAGDRSWKRLSGLMDRAEAYYEVARRSLVVPDPSLYRLAAQKQYLGLEFLRRELPDSLYRWPLTADERTQLNEKIDRTCLSLKDYLAFCESAFLNYRDSTTYRQSATPDLATPQ